MPHLNNLEYKIFSTLMAAASGAQELSKLNLVMLDKGSTRRIADALEKSARIGGSQHTVTTEARRPEFPVWIDKDLAEQLAAHLPTAVSKADLSNPSLNLSLRTDFVTIESLGLFAIECQDAIRFDEPVT